MKPGLIYRTSFKTFHDIDIIQCNISDTLVEIEDDADPEIIDLVPSGDPLHIAIVDTDEDKFTPIRSKQAVMQFLTDENYRASTFAEGPDDRWKVDIRLNPDTDNEILFLGFLVTSELSQQFQPIPEPVTLIASDHLGILKEIPLTNDAGEYMRGKFKLSEFIATSLKKTGLSLPFKAINNLRHGTGVYEPALVTFQTTPVDSIIVPVNRFFYVGQEVTITGSASNDGTYHVTEVAQTIVTLVAFNESVVTEADVTGVTFTDTTSSTHIYDLVYLDALTFELDIDEAEDCYTVLSKILGEDCYLTQHKGEWWICRVDEYDNRAVDSGFYVAEFDADGNYQSIGSQQLVREVGRPSPNFWINRDPLERFERPHNFVKETYRFVTPKELICNIDFSRGEATTPPNLAAPTSTGIYEMDCWTLSRISGAITSTSHIERDFEYGYEKERRGVITPKSNTATPWDYLESTPMEVQVGDRMSIAIDWRFPTQFGSGGATYFPARVFLLADNGDYYHWWNSSTPSDPESFYWMGPDASQLERLIPVNVNLSDINLSEWQSLNINLSTIPATGKLFIGLNQLAQGADAGDNQNGYYGPVLITYNPLINGSYQQFRGQYNKVNTVETGYLAKREKDVHMSDSPKKIFKGAMFLLIDGSYILTSVFYNSALTGLGSPSDPSDSRPYGYQQAFSVWNQYRRTIRKFSGAVLYASGLDYPDAIYRFSLTDTDPEYNDRYFLLISFDQNWKTNQLSGVLVECYHLDGKVYTDTHTFKFITTDEQ